MELTVSQIAQMLNGEVLGDGQEKIMMLAKIQDAKKNQIAFLSNPKYENFLYSSEASAVIVRKDFVPKKKIKPSLILVDDPYSCFTLLLEEYHKLISFQKVGVESPSFIGNQSNIGENHYRGAFSYIGHHATIGNNVKIYPHVYIGDRVKIGDNTLIYSGVKIYSNVVIGSNCILHSGCVIGSDGFGFAPQEDGTYKTIPQLGHVTLEDDITIGANTVIDCATFMGDSTLIRKGVKMDNLIQIAHNVEIGENTVIAAQTGISGSTKIGEKCLLAGQVGIAGHLTIADNTSLGAQTGISKSITTSGGKWFGSPAFDIKEYFRSYAVFKKLPDLHFQLREMEKKIERLKNKG